jgi:hypothetical protein
MFFQQNLMYIILGYRWVDLDTYIGHMTHLKNGLFSTEPPNYMEVIDGINHAILQLTAMIGEAISARERWPPHVAAGNAAAYVLAIDSKLESLHKQCKLAIKVGDELWITHCERMICLLEAKEAREMEGGHWAWY